MAMVWRIHLKSDLTDSPNYGEYCLKNKVVAMGWILEKHNPDIASGKIKISNFADFETCAKAKGMDCNQIRLLAEEIKAGDFIWTYVGGKYYLAQVAADSRYKYNADSEAVAYRACNQLTNIDWKCVGEYKDVDEKVASRLQRGQTLERLFADDNSDFAFGLQYTQEVFAKLSCKKTALYGAILGDIIGVPYEFDRNKPTSRDSFPLFCKESNFSDDTVTTIAIADAILKSGDEEDGRIFFKTLVETLQAWCRKYPHRGYGGNFRRWIVEKNPKPYNSYGNGSAMRVSAAGWFCDNIYDTRECARTTARITHNHKEGVKGAMATACAIFLARTGKSKEVIKSYIEYEFGYDLNRKIDDIRVHYCHTERIWETVPEAIIAFLESTDFESAIRNTVWLGGDVDTVGAITGSIAEAFYGVPDELIAECRKRLPKEMLDVIDRFNEKVFGKKKMSVPTEFTHESLSNNRLTKKFFEDVVFIHTSASGAMGDAGVLEVWNKHFEHYKCYWTSKTAEKLDKAFLPDDDVPDFKTPKKSGWCFYYMGCGHNFYIREEFAEAYLKRFESEGYGGEIYPAEEIMLRVLNGGR